MKTGNCRNPRCGELNELHFGLCPSCWLIGKAGVAFGGILVGVIVAVIKLLTR